jgi:hypothetical protein
MSLSLVDPNRVYLVGENCILRLQHEQDGVDEATCSFWRVLVSPQGPGHALFARAEILSGEVRIYSDNGALVRWLQTFELLMRPYFADKATPITQAQFHRKRETAQSYCEVVISEHCTLHLQWDDLGAPFMTRLEPNNEFVGIWSVYSCLVPARSARFEADGLRATGRAFPDTVAGHLTSTSFLALGETWLYPDRQQQSGLN